MSRGHRCPRVAEPADGPAACLIKGDRRREAEHSARLRRRGPVAAGLQDGRLQGGHPRRAPGRRLTGGARGERRMAVRTGARNAVEHDRAAGSSLSTSRRSPCMVTARAARGRGPPPRASQGAADRFVEHPPGERAVVCHEKRLARRLLVLEREADRVHEVVDVDRVPDARPPATTYALPSATALAKPAIHCERGPSTIPGLRITNRTPVSRQARRSACSRGPSSRCTGSRVGLAAGASPRRSPAGRPSHEPPSSSGRSRCGRPPRPPPAPHAPGSA